MSESLWVVKTCSYTPSGKRVVSIQTGPLPKERAMEIRDSIGPTEWAVERWIEPAREYDPDDHWGNQFRQDLAEYERRKALA